MVREYKNIFKVFCCLFDMELGMKIDLCKGGAAACMLGAAYEMGVAMSCFAYDSPTSVFYGGVVSAAILGLNAISLEGLADDFSEMDMMYI